MPIFGRKWGFFFLRVVISRPPNLFCTCMTEKKTCVAGYGSRKLGVSGPPHPKNGLSLPKNGLNMPILGQKRWFLGLGSHFKAPAAYLASFWLKQTCVSGYGSRKMGVSGPPQPKNGHFCPKMAEKCQFWAKIQCFLGSGGQFKAPSPYLQVLDSNQHVLRGMGLEKLVLQGRPTPKNGFFAQKWPKMQVWGQKEFFFGLGWSFLGPPTQICRYLTQKENVLQGIEAGKWLF